MNHRERGNRHREGQERPRNPSGTQRGARSQHLRMPPSTVRCPEVPLSLQEAPGPQGAVALTWTWKPLREGLLRTEGEASASTGRRGPGLPTSAESDGRTDRSHRLHLSSRVRAAFIVTNHLFATQPRPLAVRTGAFLSHHKHSAC